MIKFIFLFVMSLNSYALTSYVNQNEFNAYFNAEFSSTTPVSNCFDSNSTTNCGSVSGGTLTIDFNNTVDVTNFNPSIVSNVFAYSHVIIDDITSYQFGSLPNSFDGISKIQFFSNGSSVLLFNEVSFDFENVAVLSNLDDKSINWSAFSYSFTIVAFFFLFGRGIKAVLDLLKFG